MSVPGAPGVWALGDCAAVPNEYDGSVSPPTAQFTERQAKQLAANLLRKVRGRPTRPFRYRPMGQLSAIGHNKAVAQILGARRLRGMAAMARVLPAQDSDARAESPAVPRVELGDVLSARYRTLELHAYAACLTPRRAGRFGAHGSARRGLAVRDENGAERRLSKPRSEKPRCSRTGQDHQTLSDL
jgi:hypothetical protein